MGSVYVNRFSDMKKAIIGDRLQPGTTILPNDVYDSTTGEWEPAGETFAGELVPKSDYVTWIRPAEESVPAAKKERGRG